MEAVQERLICVVEKGVAVREVGVVGEVVSGVTVMLEVVTVTLVAVVWFPAASLAVAVREWVPFVAEVVFQVMEYGAVVSSVPRLVPSSLNWTPDTAMLSEAVAERVTVVPETVEPVVGAVREMVGGVVSGVGATYAER